MCKKLELLNSRFGRLIVIKDVGVNKHKKSMWLCRCDCETELIVCGSSLKNEHTKSCGCLQKEIVSEIHKNKIVSDKSRMKMSLAWKNRAPVSIETRKKMSENNKGKNNPMFGKKHSEESKRKNSESQKGNIPGFKGKKHSIESRRKMSEAAKKRIKHGLTGTKEYANMKEAKRRALKLNQTPVNTSLKEIHSIYKICSDMNKLAGKASFHVDHIIPLSKGGLHHEDNLQILSAKDNLSKGTKILYGGEYGKGIES